MTRVEAIQIIEACRGWNTSQTSVRLALQGIRTNEDDLLDAKRRALEAAWARLAEQEEGAGE